MTNPFWNLSRGLSTLLSSGLQRNPAATAEAESPRSLPLTCIHAGRSQPRRTLAGRENRGVTDIPVVIRERSNQEAVAIALIENIQREQLTPAPESRALVRKTLEGKGRAPCATSRELSVVTEVLGTPEVRVWYGRGRPAGKLIVEFANPDSRDAIIAAIETAVSS